MGSASDSRQQVVDVLATIDDPEMPISIVDLGIVVDVAIEGAAATVTLTPTYTGCPALQMIDDLVTAAVGRVPGIDHVRLHHVFDPPWTAERISPAGRDRLHDHGIVVSPPGTVELTISARPRLHCPFCGSDDTRVDSPFGVTRCRATYYCTHCRNPFEHIKSAANPA